MEAKELINSSPVWMSGEDSINAIFTCIAGTSSKLEKEAFLKTHMNSTIKLILQDTYGGRKYFVKKYEIFDSGKFTLDEHYSLFHQLLDNLAGRRYTGGMAVDMVQSMIEQFCSRDQIWLARILNGNLKIGAGQTFSEDTGTIEKYPCALANVLEKVKNVNVLDGTWYASRKLDGCRCHAHVDIDNNIVEFISRQGKKFTTLNNLTQPVLDFIKASKELGLSGKWVLDGEVCIMDGDKEDFRGLMSLVRRKDYTIERPRYKVFDLLTEDEFWGRESSPNFSVRRDMLVMLANNYSDPRIDVIEQELITSQEVLDKWHDQQITGGWEGIMVRKDVPYEGKRTNNLLKIKPFQDAEYKILDIIEGDMTYNTTSGSETVHGVSALQIRHRDNIVKVGSGMTKEQRIAWAKDPSLIVGKTATIQYFEETQDSKTGEYSLRFPVLKHVYENERDL